MTAVKQLRLSVPLLSFPSPLLAISRMLVVLTTVLPHCWRFWTFANFLFRRPYSIHCYYGHFKNKNLDRLTACNCIIDKYNTLLSCGRVLYLATRSHLQVPRMCLRFEEHAFSVVTPKAWNNPPLHVRTAENTDTLQQRLQTFIFCKFYQLRLPADFMQRFVCNRLFSPAGNLLCVIITPRALRS